MAPTIPKPHHSPYKRTRIATAYFKGVSAKAIACDESISPRAVYAIVDRYKVQKSAKSLPRSRRPTIFDESYKRYIFRLIKNNLFILGP